MSVRTFGAPPARRMPNRREAVGTAARDPAAGPWRGRRLAEHMVRALERFANHAILCPLNTRGQEINQRMTERMQPRTYICSSFDKRDDTADSIHPDMIDLLGHRSGVPPHELVLFVGAIVSVMRNLDIVAGPCHVMVLAAAARSMAPPLREASLPRSRRCLGSW